jgi:hypothetical protein
MRACRAIHAPRADVAAAASDPSSPRPERTCLPTFLQGTFSVFRLDSPSIEAAFHKIPRAIRPALSLLVLVALMGLAGCGGNGGGADDSSTAANDSSTAAREAFPLVRAARRIPAADPSLSKARFVARVNRLCRAAWPVIRRNLAAYESKQDRRFSEQRRFRQAFEQSLAPEVKARIFDPMMALGAPREDKRQLVEAMRWLGEAIEIGQGAHGGYPITSPVVVWDLFDIFNPLARRYGLGECLVNGAHTGFE